MTGKPNRYQIRFQVMGYECVMMMSDADLAMSQLSGWYKDLGFSSQAEDIVSYVSDGLKKSHNSAASLEGAFEMTMGEDDASSVARKNKSSVAVQNVEKQSHTLGRSFSSLQLDVVPAIRLQHDLLEQACEQGTSSFHVQDNATASDSDKAWQIEHRQKSRLSESMDEMVFLASGKEAATNGAKTGMTHDLVAPEVIEKKVNIQPFQERRAKPKTFLQRNKAAVFIVAFFCCQYFLMGLKALTFTPLDGITVRGVMCDIKDSYKLWLKNHSPKASDSPKTLIPYMHFLAVDTKSDMSRVPAGHVALQNCSVQTPCYVMHNGAYVQFNVDNHFGRLDSESRNAWIFDVDPDGPAGYSGGITMVQHADGRIETGERAIQSPLVYSGHAVKLIGKDPHYPRELWEKL